MDNKVKFFALALGSSSLGSQIVLLRQCLTVFYSNELFIGFLLAIWLVWVGLGSYLGQRLWQRHAANATHFVVLQMIALGFVFLSFVLVKLVRTLLPVPYGEYIPFSWAVLFLFFTFALPCLLFGGSFALLAQLGRSDRRESAATVYAYEAIASCVVGLLTTILFEITSNLPALVMLTALAVFYMWLAVRRRLLLFVFLSLAAASFAPHWHFIETVLLQHFWQSTASGMELKDWKATRFGEACLVDWQGELIYYHNGAKVSVIGDSVTTQKEAALVMCSHPSPERILIVEGSAAGLADECAQFSAEVHDITLDKGAFELVAQWREKRKLALPPDQSARTTFGDARYLLQQKNSKWDIIALNVGKPYSANANRFYSQRFIKLVKHRLCTDGVFVICSFPFGENYLGPELARLNRILRNTVMAEFKYLVIVPGDAAFYFASNSRATLTTEVEQLVKRYNRFSRQQRYFSPQMFHYLYLPDRLQRAQEALSGVDETRINSDFRPISYLYDMLIWHKIVRQSQPFYRALARAGAKPPLYFFIIVGSGLILLLFLSKQESRNVLRVHSIAFIVGFTAMALNIVLLLVFQSLFGYLYFFIGGAMAGFMLGAAAASGFLNINLARINAGIGLAVLLAVTSLLCFIVLPLAAILGQWHSIPLYFFLIFLAGASAGAAFPLLCRAYKETTLRTNFGSIYAADVLGGALGSIVITAWLIPVYGFAATLHGASLACLAGLVLLLPKFAKQERP